MSARNPRIRLTESGQDKVDTKDLADEIAAHLGDEHGEADHDVTPDTSQEDLMPLQCAPGSRGVGDKVLDGTGGQARVLDEDRTEKEGSGEVSPDYRRPSYRGQPLVLSRCPSDSTHRRQSSCKAIPTKESCL